jgi:DNA adenine methylase
MPPDPQYVSIRPLLKWAGGKRQLLPVLRRYYPAGFDRYLEPFVGSGAVFFDLYGAGRLSGRRVLLTDVNADLIGCYRAVRDEANAVIEALAGLDEEHRARGVACYYDVRDRRFNPARAALGDALADRYTPALAAMLIYLNRTGFNGLFRLNRRGEFNVPAGRYTDPRICDGAHVRAVARTFGAPGVSIEHARFDATLSDARTGDFVYCDPPYAPISRTSSFAHYTADGFTADDHRGLQKAAVAAARRGALVLLSHSSAPEIERAYGDAATRRAGFTVRRVAARRAINAQAMRRGPVDELIVTNAIAARGRLRMAKSTLGAERAGRRGRLQ